MYVCMYVYTYIYNEAELRAQSEARGPIKVIICLADSPMG